MIFTKIKKTILTQIHNPSENQKINFEEPTLIF
jgi:hypothetical protein